MDFNELLFGRKNEGEYQLRWFLREHGYIVKDVSSDPTYWEQDIDMIATNVFSHETVTIEVKWDNQLSQTGNLFIELENPRSQNGKGWLEFCLADYLAYGDAVNGIFYFIKLSDLRNYIYESKEDLRKRSSWDGSVGYTIPIREVSAHIAVFTAQVKRGE